MRIGTHNDGVMPVIDPAMLEKAMNKVGMSPIQLAKATNISRSYVNDILKNRRHLKNNPALRRSIAAALDVPIHWIEASESTPEEAA